MSKLYRNINAYKSTYMTTKEVAFVMYVTDRTIRNWVKEGKLKAWQPDKNCSYRFRTEDVKKMLGGNDESG